MRFSVALMSALLSVPAIGQETAPADYDAKVKRYLEGTLKDPFSVVLEQTKAPHFVQGNIKRGLLGKKPYRGWLACYRMNAKNSYGAYTGFSNVAFLLTDEGAIRYLEGDGSDVVHTWDEQLMGNHCPS